MWKNVWMAEATRLQERLYPRLESSSSRSKVSKLLVTILRATNLPLPGFHWFPPQAVVALGNHERRSPLGEAFGPDPIFDWRVELPFTGHESHLAFEVICEGQLMGGCILPLHDVLAACSSSTEFRRALTLGEANDESASPELWVVISTALEGRVYKFKDIGKAEWTDANRIRMQVKIVKTIKDRLDFSGLKLFWPLRWFSDTSARAECRGASLKDLPIESDIETLEGGRELGHCRYKFGKNEDISLCDGLLWPANCPDKSSISDSSTRRQEQICFHQDAQDCD